MNLTAEFSKLRSRLKGAFCDTSNLQEQIFACKQEISRLSGDVESLRMSLPSRAGGGVFSSNELFKKDYIDELYALLKPMDVVGFDFVRIGRQFDGGYVMLNSKLENGVAYSFGISNDVSWDADMASRGNIVFQYDPTIEKLPMEHPAFRWEKIGVASDDITQANVRDAQLLPLAEIIAKNDPSHSADMIWKMDIEGAEWDSIVKCPAEVLNNVYQIVIELHWVTQFDDAQLLARKMAFLRKLRMTHEIVHIHANNFGVVGIICGKIIPDILEVTLVRRRDHEFAPCSRIFPTSLDSPCNSNDFDIYLGAFGVQ